MQKKGQYKCFKTWGLYGPVQIIFLLLIYGSCYRSFCYILGQQIFSMISLRFASVVLNNTINEHGLYNIISMEFSFSTTDGSGSATVVSQPLSFSAQQRLISSTVVEFEGRPSSKPAHAQMTPNVIITVAEPSVVENENSLITQLNWSPLLIQFCRIHSLMQPPYTFNHATAVYIQSRNSRI